MHITIMGTGGMGGYLGIKMAVAGYDVSFIARGAHYDAIKKNGLKLISASDGDLHIKNAKVVNDPAEIGKTDLIIFAVKLYDTAQAAKAIMPIIKKDTIILSVQNGITSKPEIEGITGKDNCTSASIFVSAHVEAPGIIKHNGGFNKISFGGKHSNYLKKIFDDISLDYEIIDDTGKMLWSKFALLAANSAAGSLLKRGAVEISQNPQLAPIFKAAALEVIKLAQAMNIDLDDTLADDMIIQFKNRPKSQEIYASQLTALNAGKKLELYWIQGEIHRLGLKYNVPTPIHSLTLELLKPFAEGR
jgi:2-dehydropantoate 2-reductase